MKVYSIARLTNARGQETKPSEKGRCFASKKKKEGSMQKAAVAASPFFRTRVAEVAVQPKSGRGSMD